MFPVNPRPRPLFWVVACAGLILDQATKWWAETALLPVGRMEIIPGFFNLTYVENTGMAFGLGSGHNWLLFGVVILLLVFALVLSSKLDWKQQSNNIAAAAVVCGAAGNLIDRIRHGYVIDFLDFYVKNWHWPAFNIADSCICLSLVWIALRQIKQ